MGISPGCHFSFRELVSLNTAQLRWLWQKAMCPMCLAHTYIITYIYIYILSVATGIVLSTRSFHCESEHGIAQGP